MKKTILSILIILMMAQTVFAQQCVDQVDYAISKGAGPSSFALPYATVDFDSAEEAAVKGSTVVLSINPKDFYPGCYNNQPDTPAFNNLFTYMAESFELSVTDNEVWQDSAINGDQVAFLFADFSTDTNYLVFMNPDGTVKAAAAFSGATSVVHASTLTIAPDGTAYVGGTSDDDGWIGSFKENFGNVGILTSYDYVFSTYTVIVDSGYDDKSGYPVFAGYQDQPEGASDFFVVGVEPDGDVVNKRLVSPYQRSTTDIRIGVYPRTGDDSLLYVAGRDTSGDMFYGTFEIASDGEIAAEDCLKVFQPTAESNHRNIKAMEIASNGNAFFTFVTRDVDMYLYPAVAVFDDDCAVVDSKYIDQVIYDPDYDLDNQEAITFDNKAMFIFYNEYFAIINPGVSLSTYHMTAATALYLTTMEQFTDGTNQYVGLGYTVVGDINPSTALFSYPALGTLSSVNLVNNQEEMVFLAQDILPTPSNPTGLKFYVISNNGGGFQGYGNGPSPSGLVPEFSLPTLLLAVLLAGGLVLFVVRRKYE